MIAFVKKLLGKDPNADDPYWDAFLNRPLADPNNLVLDVITKAPGGGVFNPKIDVHDPKAMFGHIVELTKFFGADLIGVTDTDPALVRMDNAGEEPLSGEELKQRYPLTVVSLAHWPYDAQKHQGMGGQLGRQRVAAAHFHLRSYIREIGYEAVFGRPLSTAVAQAAGIGKVQGGKLRTEKYGDQVVLETVVLTNLPMTVPGK